MAASASGWRRRSDVCAAALDSATVNPQDGDTGGLGGARVRYTVPAVSGHVSTAARPPRPRHRRRAYDQMAQAGSRGPDLHTAQSAAGAHRRQLPGPHSPARPRVRRDQRNPRERRRLVRVFSRVSTAH